MLQANEILEYYKKHQELPAADKYEASELTLMYKLLHLENREVRLESGQKRKIWSSIKKEVQPQRTKGNIWDAFKILAPVALVFALMFFNFSYTSKSILQEEIVDVGNMVNEFVALEEDARYIDTIASEFASSFEDLLIIEVVEAADDFEGAFDDFDILDLGESFNDDFSF